MKVSKPKQRKSSKKKKKKSKKSKSSKKQASDLQSAFAMPTEYNPLPRSQLSFTPNQFVQTRQQGYQQQPSYMNYASPVPSQSTGYPMESMDPSMYAQMGQLMNSYQQQQQQNGYGNQMMMLSKMMKIPQIIIKVPAPIVNVPTPIVNVSLID